MAHDIPVLSDQPTVVARQLTDDGDALGAFNVSNSVGNHKNVQLLGEEDGEGDDWNGAGCGKDLKKIGDQFQPLAVSKLKGIMVWALELVFMRLGWHRCFWYFGALCKGVRLS